MDKLSYLLMVAGTLISFVGCGVSDTSKVETLTFQSERTVSDYTTSRDGDVTASFSGLEKNLDHANGVSEYSQGSLLKRGTYDDFLTQIRVFESSIDPKKAQYYTDNYDNPAAVPYPEVEYPGRVIRDNAGNPVRSTTSIKGYFEKLGIDHLYQKGTTDPEVFRQMQYAVINYLGFVGYQFSEQDLWVLGYYEHTTPHGDLPIIYSDVPNSVWANGVRSVMREVPDFGLSIVTDVNTWEGIWLGKHGINSFKDLIDPVKQDFVAKDHFKYKYDRIVEFLAKHEKTIQQYLGTKLYWDRCIPPVSPPPGGRSNEVVVTMSGLLAGAHLRGAAGVEALLIDHENHADENGTTILQYVQDFGGYQTPFGSTH